MGTIVARLLPEQAPQSVAHFVALAEGRLGWPDPSTGEPRKEPYYDGARVTRAVASELVEAGERADLGRSVPPFFVGPEGEGPVNFSAPGRLGMKRSVMNRVSAVKFVITAGSLPYLNRQYPCFGTIVSGLDVAQRMSEVKTYRSGAPIEPVTLKKIRIRKVGNPAPLPDPVPYVPKADTFGPRIAPR
jgi:peptidyl-prolyl cis-trans isomerase A (cyclophilin A)